MSDNAPAVPLFDALVAEHRDRPHPPGLPASQPRCRPGTVPGILMQLWTHLPGFRGEA